MTVSSGFVALGALIARLNQGERPTSAELGTVLSHFAETSLSQDSLYGDLFVAVAKGQSPALQYSKLLELREVLHTIRRAGGERNYLAAQVSAKPVTGADVTTLHRWAEAGRI